MKDGLRKMVEEYIEECDTVIETKNHSEACKLQKKITSVFGNQNFIPDIRNGLDRLLVVPMNGTPARAVDYMGNIEKLREKLRLFLYTKDDIVSNDTYRKNITINANSNVSGSGNSTNTNTNTVNATFDIKTELDKARQTIEDDEVLGDEDKEEINAKLDEIETVMAEDPSNNEKWKKLKSVVNWVTTKGYKIGQLVMPLITKALFPDAE
ncbi:MAG: hypothetical protein E7J99_09405 [Clostridium butyricum]|uniref:hypothetical protein n=1 Tax=Clostridium sp. TaxID=1506 RepID=UPI0029023CA5|nr:hypothetical protein [Clostridium sp.]MDU1116033.1 hypothetical protein [Clostridium sp.]MDU7712360.1 hypothetical protein [Clostridium butyricum]